MPIVVVPGHGEVSFPDSMDDKAIVTAIERDLMPQKQRNPLAGDGPRTLTDHIGSAVQAISEPIAALATGAAGQVLGGLAGGAAALTPGLREGIGADVSQRVSDALTYRPKSAGGKAVMDVVSMPGEYLADKAGKAGQYVMDKTGSPLAATAVDTGIQALPMLVGGALGRAGVGTESAASIAARAAAKSKNAKIDAGITAARDAGYVLTPSDVGAGAIASTVESLSGSPKLAKQASRKNQGNTNDLIKRDVGLPEDLPGDRAAIAQIRADAGQAYEAVKNTGTITTDAKYASDLQNASKSYDTAAKDFAHRSENPFTKTLEGLSKDKFDAASAVEEVKLLRKDADKAYAQRDKALGKVYKQAAQALDDMIQRHVQKLAVTSDMSGDPTIAGMVRDYQAARTKIAKTYAADKALNDTTGNFDAGAYARALKSGKFLSGDAETVGRFAQQFPRSAQPVERLGSTGPTLVDLAGAALGKDALLLGARPAARAALLTGPAQRMFAKPQTYNRGTLARLYAETMRNGGAIGAVPAITRNEQGQ